MDRKTIKYCKLYDSNVVEFGYIGAYNLISESIFKSIDIDRFSGLEYNFTTYVLKKMISEKASLSCFEDMLINFKDNRFTNVYNNFFYELDYNSKDVNDNSIKNPFFFNVKIIDETYSLSYDNAHIEYLKVMLKCVDSADIRKFYESRFVLRVLDVLMNMDEKIDPLVKEILLQVEKNPIFAQEKLGHYRTFFDSMMTDLITDISASKIADNDFKQKYISYFEEIYPDFKERILKLMIALPTSEGNTHGNYVTELKIRYGIRDWVDYIGFKEVFDKIGKYVETLNNKSNQVKKFEDMGISSSILVSFQKYDFKNIVWDELFSDVNDLNFGDKNTVAVYFLCAFLSGTGNNLNMSDNLAHKINQVLTDSFLDSFQDKEKIYITGDLSLKLKSLLEVVLIDNSTNIISKTTRKTIKQKI